MTKKSIWESQTWQIVVAIGVIVGIIASILTILEFLGKINLPKPWANFMDEKISAFYFLGVIIFSLLGIILGVYFALRNRKPELSKPNSILDDIDARRIAILCQTPRTTDFLRQQYQYWQGQRDWVVLGGYGFDDFMKLLEKEGYLTYDNQNKSWRVSTDAIEYIRKYHGG